jgi:hypothetical protein
MMSDIGKGGPVNDPLVIQQMKQEELRNELMRNDPDRFRSFVQRGFDTLGPSGSSASSGMATQLMDANNPAVQMPGYVVSAQPQQQIGTPQERARNDLLWASYNSQRGQARQAAKVSEDMELQRQIEAIQRRPVPAEYDENPMTPLQRQLMRAMRNLTGTGGGLR